MSIKDHSNVSRVDNTFVFIADSLRADYLPEKIAQRGHKVTAISPSTRTGSSIPSMMTSVPPRSHQVWDFSNTVPAPPIIFKGKNAGMDLRTIWQHVDDPAEKPPMRILRQQDQVFHETAEEPFTVVKHDTGSHAPYNRFNADPRPSPREFFERNGDNWDYLREQYLKSAEYVADRFLQAIEDLDDRGVLDRTLVIFTSDHGELLGEKSRGGIWGHSEPLCPELVTVPMVFMGAGIKGGTKSSIHAGGIDIVPTILGAQEKQIPDRMQGVDLWNQEPNPDRPISSDCWMPTARLRYGASSAWDASGGYVVHHESTVRRAGYAVRQLHSASQAPAASNSSLLTKLQAIRVFGASEETYGNPGNATRDAVVREFETEQREYHITTPTQEQLEALGYVQ